MSWLSVVRQWPAVLNKAIVLVKQFYKLVKFCYALEITIRNTDYKSGTIVKKKATGSRAKHLCWARTQGAVMPSLTATSPRNVVSTVNQQFSGQHQ